jgi:hypothetical protein
MANASIIFIQNFSPVIPDLCPPKPGVLAEPCLLAILGRFAKSHQELVCFGVENIAVATDYVVSKSVITPNGLECRHFDLSKRFY